jgi:hypothetical protein
MAPTRRLKPLYTAANGCYVVRSISVGEFDLRGPKHEHIGDHVYWDLERAKAAADIGGEYLYGGKGPYNPEGKRLP